MHFAAGRSLIFNKELSSNRQMPVTKPLTLRKRAPPGIQSHAEWTLLGIGVKAWVCDVLARATDLNPTLAVSFETLYLCASSNVRVASRD